MLAKCDSFGRKIDLILPSNFGKLEKCNEIPQYYVKFIQLSKLTNYKTPPLQCEKAAIYQISLRTYDFANLMTFFCFCNQNQ